MRIDLSDAEQARLRNAYGAPGTALLEAARASEAGAALDLGLLRTLDGHFTEGEAWLQAAQASGSKEAVELLGTAVPVQRKAAAARCALGCAALLNGSALEHERKALLLERAARTGSREAAGMLVAHFERLGDAGSAARWRLAADEDK